MKNIVVCGEYGIRSLGDEAMLHVMANNLTRRLGDISLTPLGRLIAIPMAEEDVETLCNRIAEEMHASWINLMANAREPEKLHDALPVGKVWDVMGDDREWAALERADLLLLGGGNLFLDVNPNFLFGSMTYFTFMVAAAKTLNVPVMMIGVSVGPLLTTWAHKLTAWVLDNCAAVTVRDQMSLKLVRKLGGEAELLPDLALGISARESNIKEGQYLAVAPKWTGDDSEIWGPKLARTLDRICDATGLEPLMIPHCTFERSVWDDDTNMCKWLKDKVKTGHLVEGPGTRVPEAVLGVYAKCEAAITMRLHGAIFSAMAGTPFVALNYWPKVRGFCEYWAGSPCLEMDSDRLLETFLALWELRDKERERLRQRVDEIRPLLERHWDIVEEILE